MSTAGMRPALAPVALLLLPMALGGCALAAAQGAMVGVNAGATLAGDSAMREQDQANPDAQMQARPLPLPAVTSGANLQEGQPVQALVLNTRGTLAASAVLTAACGILTVSPGAPPQPLRPLLTDGRRDVALFESGRSAPTATRFEAQYPLLDEAVTVLSADGVANAAVAVLPPPRAITDDETQVPAAEPAPFELDRLMPPSAAVIDAGGSVRGMTTALTGPGGGTLVTPSVELLRLALRGRLTVSGADGAASPAAIGPPRVIQLGCWRATGS
ncbi:hypothetical protein [Zavarzinia sp. CC-PAN008]|uniref:hypothetical protein n=1 Tax=Zavarzinia sp. CC-PAN008 TaxID=3243332 RepID=UPI003F7464E4